MRETLVLTLLCLLIAAASLAAVVWTVVRAALEGMFVGAVLTLDSLLLISIGLLLSLMFGFCALWLARDAGLLEVVRRRRAAPANPGREQPSAESPPRP